MGEDLNRQVLRPYAQKTDDFSERCLVFSNRKSSEKLCSAVAKIGRNNLDLSISGSEGFSPTASSSPDWYSWHVNGLGCDDMKYKSHPDTDSKHNSWTLLLKIIKYLWALPVTLLGLVAVALTAATGGYVQQVSGVIEACGGFAAWILERVLGRRVSAMTIGHVILGIDKPFLSRAREHEHVHIEQYEKWGPLFIPLYLGSSLLAWLQGKHYYRDNVFEREAYGRVP